MNKHLKNTTAKARKRMWSIPTNTLKRAKRQVEYLPRTLFEVVKNGSKLRHIIRIRWLLTNSYHAKLLAIDKVTRWNNGKKTAGVDGVKIKLDGLQELKVLTNQLHNDINRMQWHPRPNRRINIPKPDGTTRPLGIPTQYDRIVQAVLTNVLEVQMETSIHIHQLNSFGFRRNMSTADATNMLAPYSHVGKHGIVIEADISKCFDRISHQYLLETVGQEPQMKEMVKRLLEAGPLDDLGNRVTDDKGTPQGGIISPVISNLVLRKILDLPLTGTKRTTNTTNQTLTTYADDLVITLSPQTRITKDQTKLQKWITDNETDTLAWLTNQLAIAGLELKASKTRVITDDTPLVFLGYQIQRGQGIRIDPEKVKKLRAKLKGTMKRGRSATRVKKELNPILRGFYNYAAKFSSGKMWKPMGKIDWDITKRVYKLYEEYDIGQVKYTDVPKTVIYMAPPKGATWLTDQNYWDSRNLGFLAPRKRFLYKKQQGICPLCHC